MEEHLSPASAVGERIEGVAGRLAQSRAQTREMLGNHRTKLANLEATLSERIAGLQKTLEWQRATQGHLDDLAAELAESQQQLELRESELTTRRQQIQDRGRRIAATFRRQRTRHLQALRDRHDQLESLASSENEQLTDAREQLELQAQQLDAARVELEQLQAVRAEDDQQLQQARAELDEARAELERAGQQFDAARSELQQQRDQNQALTERLAARQGDDQALSQKLEDISSERAVLAASLGEAESALQAARQQQDAQDHVLEEITAERDALAASLDEAQQHLQVVQQESASPPAELQEKCQQAEEDVQRLTEVKTVLEQQLAQLAEARQNEAAELDGLRTERDELAQRLADAESRTGQGEDSAQEIEDLKSRLELSLDDLRELRDQNESLGRELAEARSASPSGTNSGGGGLDWEAQKRRLLAELDAEFDDDDPAVQEQRASFEERIQVTDQIIAAKDRKIEAMRQEIVQAKAAIEAQAAKADQADVEALAIAEVLNQDELIARERERLEQIQTEWREKLRGAEVEISVERAKLARERAGMEEQIQTLKSKMMAASEQVEEGKGSKPGRGRWLARLGLQDNEES